MEVGPKFGQILQLDKPNTTTEPLPDFRELESQNLVKLYIKTSLILQHYFSKAPVELGPKFGQILQLDMPTYYSTATPRLQWSESQKFGQILQLDKLNTTVQLLQGSSGASTKIWSKYTSRQS